MIRTLVVEDERVAAQAHAQYVRDVPGFELVAVAMSAQDAARVLRAFFFFLNSFMYSDLAFLHVLHLQYL